MCKFLWKKIFKLCRSIKYIYFTYYYVQSKLKRARVYYAPPEVSSSKYRKFYFLDSKFKNPKNRKKQNPIIRSR